jgi:uncharacterized protein (TIGR03437 family)
MQKATKITTAALCGIIPAVLYSYATGPDPRYTGAPGDSTCATGGCHAGTALNGGGGNVQLISSAGASYTPGQQQTFTITITDARARAYGFQATARPDSNPSKAQAGDFTAGTQQQVICENGRSKGSGGCASSAPVQFIEHNRPFGTNAINFTWTAPATDVGPVTIYVAANAANGNNDDSGDHIYTTRLQLTPSSPVTGNKPAIREGGVVSASAFQPSAGVAPGTWLEIYGSNLATASRLWDGSDFNGNTAPTSLDGVSVTIGGKSAYVDYISPGQVNVQVPDGIPIGAGVPLVLRNAQGESEPYILQTGELAPALLAPPSFTANGKQLVVATFPVTNANSVVYVGRKGSVSGIDMQPASPGDIITLYGIGFGPVAPSAAAGTIVTQANTLTNPVTILFGDTQAEVEYAGLAPGYVGLYQFNVKVPNVPADDWLLTIQAGGRTLAQTIYTSTQ